MNLRDLDLTHLTAFEALFRHRGVSQAARALEVPQSTVSRWLNKLRISFNDPLFVRTQHGMEPTPAAVLAVEAVREILHIYHSRLLLQAGVFDPAQAVRNFSIAASDFGHMLVIPRLQQWAAALAPKIRFTATPLGQHTLIKDLESGDVDLAVGGFPNLDAGILQQRLFVERYVCVVRVDHPTIKHAISLEQFRNALHIVVAAHQLGHIHQAVEKRLLEVCPAENVRVLTQSFIVGALFVERTDLVLTVPAKVAELLSARGQLQILQPPLDLPDFDVKQYWHQRFNLDAGNQWLRRSIAALIGPGSTRTG